MKSKSDQAARSKREVDGGGEYQRRLWASRRLSELYRLALHRRNYGVALDKAAWAFALAATLVVASRGPYTIAKGKMRLWPGLDVVELAEAMRKSGFPSLRHTDFGGVEGDFLGAVVDRIDQSKQRNRYREVRSDKLGRVIGLTSDERTLLKIRSILASDETDDERRARNTQAKRDRDRERQRAKRSGKCRSRSEFEAGAVSRSKPWLAEGVSRATFYRRLARASATSATDLSHSRPEPFDTQATDLSHGADGPSETLATDLSQASDSAADVGETGASLHPYTKYIRARRQTCLKSSGREKDESDDLAEAIACLHRPVF